MGVSVAVGLMQFTRILAGASSMAIAFVSMIAPALAAAKAPARVSDARR